MRSEKVWTENRDNPFKKLSYGGKETNRTVTRQIRRRGRFFLQSFFRFLSDFLF